MPLLINYIKAMTSLIFDHGLDPRQHGGDTRSCQKKKIKIFFLHPGSCYLAFKENNTLKDQGSLLKTSRNLHRLRRNSRLLVLSIYVQLISLRSLRFLRSLWFVRSLWSPWSLWSLWPLWPLWSLWSLCSLWSLRSLRCLRCLRCLRSF